MAHHLWQLLEPPEGNLFWRSYFSTNIFRKVQWCFGILLILVKWWLTFGNMHTVHHNKKKKHFNFQTRAIGLYIISDTKSLLLTHVTHVAVLGKDPCGMHVGTSKHSQTCCVQYNQFPDQRYSPLIPRNQRVSHPLPPQTARIHKLNAPIFL